MIGAANGGAGCGAAVALAAGPCIASRAAGRCVRAPRLPALPVFDAPGRDCAAASGRSARTSTRPMAAVEADGARMRAGSAVSFP